MFQRITTNGWLSQPTTWSHLCIPINASTCLRHIKGFLSSLKAQQRLTTTLGNTFPHLSDSGTFHTCQNFKCKHKCCSTQGFATSCSPALQQESGTTNNRETWTIWAQTGKQNPELWLFQDESSSLCRMSCFHRRTIIRSCKA